jgi:NhaA family Na+:H+ antiporter
MSQAQAIIDAETRLAGHAVMRHGPSESALRELDALHDRIESPASRLHRAVEPWSSYVVLPLFALANAGVVWSSGALVGRGRLMLATAVALVVGKLAGIVLGARAAVHFGIASMPETYTWRQVAGAGALGGIGFTMSLFIAGAALEGADFAATKLAVFGASLAAGALGVGILWRRQTPGGSVDGESGGQRARIPEQGTPIERTDTTYWMVP